MGRVCSCLLSLLLLALAGGCPGGMPGARLVNKVPVLGGGEKYLPENGAVPGLARKGRPVLYRTARMEEYLGRSAALYINYGAEGLGVCDYTLNGEDRLVTVESYAMESRIAASGLYHYFRGKRLRDQGRPADVGAEAVLDEKRKGRNLYFYKQMFFVKVVYSGPEPVPDLLPLGRSIADRIPGQAQRPKHYDMLEVAGVELGTARVAPGYTFNYDFLPPGIFAKAPEAGYIAEVFLIHHATDDEAVKTGQKYRTYLEINGLDYTVKYTGRRRLVWWARDPDQGRVICTVYDNYLIGVLRPETYEGGEIILDRIVRRMGGE